MTTRPTFVRGLTLLGTVALVVGNMVGTSVYTLPASLAETVGPYGILAWALTAFGYLFVALVYARLGVRYPRTGGPYVYAREAFGEFAGFQTVWAYWFSAVIGNAAIATGVVAYISGLVPALGTSVWLQFAVGQSLVWGLCLVNIVGVRESARVQITIMFLNLVPLVLISGIALFAFDPQNLTPFAPHGTASIATGAALVVWAYSGVESATVPAEEVQSPERTISRGTMIGYTIGTAVFLLTAVAVAGAMPNDVVASSARPLALVAERTSGAWGGRLLSAAAIVAGMGTLNGWILLAGRIPVSACADGIFFRGLAQLHPRFGTPHRALLVSTTIASALLLMYFARPLLGVFNFIVLLAVLTTLLPHLFAAAAEMMLARRDRSRYTAAQRRRAEWIALIAFVFVLYTIYGVGPEVALWGFLVVLAGTPLYVWFKTRDRVEVATGAG